MHKVSFPARQEQVLKIIQMNCIIDSCIISIIILFLNIYSGRFFLRGSFIFYADYVGKKLSPNFGELLSTFFMLMIFMCFRLLKKCGQKGEITSNEKV